MLSRNDVIEWVRDVGDPTLRNEKERMDTIDLWYRWQHQDLVLPRRSTEELRSLLQLAKTPWLGLVVTNVAQAMYVDGYRTPEAKESSRAWRLWEANDLDGRQGAFHRAALAYGQCYGTGLPGVNDFNEPTAVLRGVSPRKMVAFYADPAEDDWPAIAIRKDGDSYRVYDDEAIYFLGWETDAGTGARQLRYIEDRRHDLGLCPVVRFTNMLDLEGRTDGEVEPFIPLAKRIDKTAYDRLLTQHFNSWKVRTVAGMAEPDSEEEANREKLRLRHEDLLVAEDPDTKFGTLPETQLDGFIRAYESDIKTLAAATQTPVHAMVGDLINLSADALAAARAELDAKVMERKKSFGKSWDQLLRLGSMIDGDDESARDVLAHVTWADVSVRSMAQAADALGKFATMLGVPVKALWRMIPNVSKSDIQEWEAMAAEGDAFANLERLLDAQATEPVG